MYERKISMSRTSLASDIPSPSEPVFSSYRRDFGGSLEALNEIRPRRTSTRRTELSGGIKKRFPVTKENSFAYGETEYHRFHRSRAQHMMYLRRQASFAAQLSKSEQPEVQL
uniref:Uncharacterized protein n=1 Tax=Cacopsylla melanoneura TaxID=428564 RepID=A0A8D8YG94_9HEMI